MISRLLLGLALALAAATQAGAQQTTWQPLGGRPGVPPYAFYTQPHAYLGQPSQPICQLTAGATVNSDGETCLSNPKAGVGYQAVTLTGVSTLALPTNLPAKGGLPILYMITHSGTDGPTLGSGFQVLGGAQPPECSGLIISGCWSTTAGATDWLPCVSINATTIGCGAVLTNMASVPPFTISNFDGGTNCNGPGTTCASNSITVAAGDVYIAAVTFCDWNAGGCGAQTPLGATVTVAKTAGTATCGAFSAFTGSTVTGADDSGVAVWRCTVSAGGTITSTATLSTGVRAIQVASFSVTGLNAAPDDGKGNTASSASTSVSITTNGALTQSNEFVLNVVYSVGTTGLFTSLPAGWTTLENTTNGQLIQYAVLSGTPTVTATATTAWAGTIIGMKHP